jgi:sugar phosphate isomerase/epimerase
MLSFSTVWNALRHVDGGKIAEEIYGLGFRAMELNFSLNQKMVEEIERFAKAKAVRITSLHNYCPTPEAFAREEALPDCYALSSLDENERRLAVAFTQRTILTAKKLRARAVVLHSGRVDIEDKTRLLIDLANKGKNRTGEYQDIAETFRRERSLRSGDFLAQTLKSFDELLVTAEENEITLGIENRFYYREIPSYDEFRIIFDRYKTKRIGYWHDVGHAFILEKLGFMPQHALLKKYAHRLCGIHLHNIKNLADHRAPIDGDLDFKELKPYLCGDIIKVLEIHGPATPEMIKESVVYLKGLCDD